MHNMVLIILGPPGSGKGTQAKKLADNYKLSYLETGAIARQLAEINSRIKDIVSAGELIPESEMTKIVTDYLEENPENLKNIIFDGFPRYPEQYVHLKNYLAEKAARVDAIVLLEVSDTEVVRRLSARRVCDNCKSIYNLITDPPKGDKCDKCGGKLVQRDDDKPVTIKERLIQYHQNTDPMLALMDTDGLLIRVNGERDISVIAKDILERIEGNA